MVRVLLAGLPRNLMGSLAAELAGQRDMAVRTDLVDSMALLLAATRGQVDVVIVGMRDGSVPGIVTHLLDERPGVLVFAMDATGVAFQYRLRPELIPLGQLSPQGLVEAIRVTVDTDPT